MKDSERIIKLETVVKSYGEELNRGRNKFDSLSNKMQNHMEEMREDFRKFQDELFEKLDKRYASKTTEKIMYAIGISMILSVMGALMALVLK